MAIPVGFADVFVRLAVAGDSEEMGVTFGVENPTGGWDQAAADDLSDIACQWLREVLCSSYTALGVRISVGSDPGSIIWESTEGTGVGANGPAALPQNVALLVRKQTASGGRRNRGRFYVPGINDGDADAAGFVTPASLAAFQVSMTGLFNGLATNGTPMVLFHSEAPFTPTVVTSLVVDSKVATQRRRLR